LYVGCSEIITVRYNELMAMMRGLQLQLQEKGKGKGKGEQGNMSAGLVAYEHLVQILARIGMDREQVRFVVGEISFFSDGLDSLNYFAMLDKFYIPTEAEGVEMGGIGQGFEPSYIEEVPEEFEDSSAPQAY
jgi:hypothetical protein